MRKSIKILLLLASFATVGTLKLTAGCGACGGHTHGEPGHKHDIVETAMIEGKFKTLVAAAKAAGLVETLQSKGPFTVFAPTDKAFAKLPEGTVENLLKPENKDKLAAILTYHVVPAKVMAKDVKTGEAPTVNGAELAIKVESGKVTVNGANVIATDVECTNGVIHVVDAVILPPTKTQG